MVEVSAHQTERDRRATRSLTGLSVGDGYGNRFLVDLTNWRGLHCPGRMHAPADYDAGADTAAFLAADIIPDGVWDWTDDTEMACGIVAELRESGGIDPDRLMAGFAEHFAEPRDYGLSALKILRAVRGGANWRPLAAGAFNGTGSLGNGAAMRIAPLGAWFADDLGHTVAQARLASEVTHTHPDGIAGGIAVAVAAALAARGEAASPETFLRAVIDRTPAGEVHTGLRTALSMIDATAVEAAAELGNGWRILATDTVPFCVWVAARHIADFVTAVRTTVSVGGDIDTTCAIVGGIVAANPDSAPIPQRWLAAREPLPAWL